MQLLPTDIGIPVISNFNKFTQSNNSIQSLLNVTYVPHISISFHTLEPRTVRGTGAGLNLVQFCRTGLKSKNFNIIKPSVGQEWDLIVVFQGGSEAKFYSPTQGSITDYTL